MQHELQLKALVIEGDVACALIFFDDELDVLQACARLLEAALGGIKFVVIAHDVAAVGIFDGEQQHGVFLLNRDAHEGEGDALPAAFDGCEGVLQRVAKHDGEVDVVDVDFFKIDIDIEADVLVLCLHLPITDEAVDSCVAIELDGLQAFVIVQNGAEMLAEFVELSAFKKLVEHNHEMLLVMAQTARFLPGFDNEVIIRLFALAQVFERLELDGHDPVIIFFLEQLHDEVGEEEERREAEKACPKQIPVAWLREVADEDEGDEVEGENIITQINDGVKFSRAEELVELPHGDVEPGEVRRLRHEEHKGARCIIQAGRGRKLLSEHGQRLDDNFKVAGEQNAEKLFAGIALDNEKIINHIGQVHAIERVELIKVATRGEIDGEFQSDERAEAAGCGFLGKAQVSEKRIIAQVGAGHDAQNNIN